MKIGYPEVMKADANWDRLAGASLRARDDLRRLADELSSALVDGRISRDIVVRARDTASLHADALRLALKHPTYRTPRVNESELPCWSTVSGRVD